MKRFLFLGLTFLFLNCQNNKFSHSSHLQKINFLTRDKIKISAYLYHRGRHQQVIIICPGFDQDKDSEDFSFLSRWFFRNGYDVLCLDFRGHGESEGIYTYGAYEKRDLTAGYKYLCQKYKGIGIIGFSLGASIVIDFLAHQRKKIKSVILVSPIASFGQISPQIFSEEMFKEALRRIKSSRRGIKEGHLFHPKPDWLDKIRKIEKSTALLFIHGQKDWLIPWKHSLWLYKEARAEIKELFLVEKGAHAEEIFINHPQLFFPKVKQWLEKTLKN
jgi:hypothetical protein